jgi:hypothetical protein
MLKNHNSIKVHFWMRESLFWAPSLAHRGAKCIEFDNKGSTWASKRYMAENDGSREVFPRPKRPLNAILKVFINRQPA